MDICSSTLCSVWQVRRDLSPPCADCDTSWQFSLPSSCLVVARSTTATLGQVLFPALEPSCDYAHRHSLFLQEALWYYPILVCTPCLRRLEARAEQPTQWKTCVRNSYPLVRESLRELFGVRGSQQVEETAADSLVFPHFTLSSFLSSCIIAAASRHVYSITVYWSCLITLLHPPCN